MRGRPKRKRFDPPKPVTQFDHLMIALAADRAVIELQNGTRPRLIAWKPRRAGGHGRRMNSHCRVEFPGGGRATLPIRLVAGIIDQDGGVHYLEGDHEELHDAGGGGARRSDLPDARQLRADGGGSAGVRDAPGQRPSPRGDGEGTGGGDRSRPAAPNSGVDPQGLRGRNAMGTGVRKGAHE